MSCGLGYCPVADCGIVQWQTAVLQQLNVTVRCHRIAGVLGRLLDCWVHRTALLCDTVLL